MAAKKSNQCAFVVVPYSSMNIPWLLCALALVVAPARAEQIGKPRRVLAGDDSTHHLAIVAPDGSLQWEVKVGAIHDAAVFGKREHFVSARVAKDCRDHSIKTRRGWEGELQAGRSREGERPREPDVPVPASPPMQNQCEPSKAGRGACLSTAGEWVDDDRRIGTVLNSKPPTGVHALPLFNLPLVLLVPKNSPIKSAEELWERDKIDDTLISLPNQ